MLKKIKAIEISTSWDCVTLKDIINTNDKIKFNKLKLSFINF